MALTFSVLAASITISAAARSSGIDALRYYVGTWTCKGAPTDPNALVSTGTATFTIQNGVLHERLFIPVKGDMTKPYTQNVTTSYDATKGRYVAASVDSSERWKVMYAAPWSGKIERWIDHQSSSGQLGRTDVIRYSERTFGTFAYPSTNPHARPGFRSFCHRDKPKEPAT